MLGSASASALFAAVKRRRKVRDREGAIASERGARAPRNFA
jgi:hypothetical protein